MRLFLGLVGNLVCGDFDLDAYANELSSRLGSWSLSWNTTYGHGVVRSTSIRPCGPYGKVMLQPSKETMSSSVPQSSLNALMTPGSLPNVSNHLPTLPREDAPSRTPHPIFMTDRILIIQPTLIANRQVVFSVPSQSASTSTRYPISQAYSRPSSLIIPLKPKPEILQPRQRIVGILIHSILRDDRWYNAITFCF